VREIESDRYTERGRERFRQQKKKVMIFTGVGGFCP
jgi:hypothetical protein